MSIASIVLNQILTMFILILIGIICFKCNIINEAVCKKLSDLLLQLISPFLIFTSYQREFSKVVLTGLFISLGLAVITHLFGILTAYILVPGKKNPDSVVERFSVIYSNCGFIGIPLINGIFGSEGIFYITAYITVFNLFLWTQGLIMMNGINGITNPKNVAKTLISPTLISIILGFICFLLQLKVPSVIYDSMEYVASMNTPLAMIVAGATIVQTSIRNLFTKVRIYLVLFLKLIFIPAVLAFLYSRLKMDTPVFVTAVLAAACPTAATGTMFAIRYHKNALYASEIFALTTLGALATIPAVMTLTDLLK